MISFFDIHNLDIILKDFYTTVGIRISIFDDEFKMVTEYPKTAPAFCRLIRETSAGLSACKNCDRAACERSKTMRKPHIYTCHAGITEAITPIQLSGGVLGYAILAHMLPTENHENAIEYACGKAAEFGIKPEISRAALDEIRPRTSEQINAAVRLLDAVASYVYIRNLVQWKNEDISAGLEKYIKSNISEPITSEILCKHLHCSRSNLYQISMRTFGMGIMQYVNYCRIECAKELLTKGCSIAETAEKTGFADYNYFCKVFRKLAGCSPSEYRKSKPTV